MTAFVLDASVTAAWLFPDEATDATRRLYARLRRDELEPQAPQLWHYECANMLANAVKRQRIAPVLIEGFWGVLEAVRHRMALHDLAPAQHKAVLGIAIDHGLSVYDASYLWLARSLQVPLATFDDRLARAAGASRVALFDIA